MKQRKFIKFQRYHEKKNVISINIHTLSLKTCIIKYCLLYVCHKIILN